MILALGRVKKKAENESSGAMAEVERIFEER